MNKWTGWPHALTTTTPLFPPLLPLPPLSLLPCLSKLLLILPPRPLPFSFILLRLQVPLHSFFLSSSSSLFIHVTSSSYLSSLSLHLVLPITFHLPVPNHLPVATLPYLLPSTCSQSPARYHSFPSPPSYQSPSFPPPSSHTKQTQASTTAPGTEAIKHRTRCRG